MAMRNFDRSAVKYAMQKATQNDCHQWFSHSFRVHQIRFRWGDYSVPQTPVVLRGPTSMEKGREGDGNEREGKRRER